LVDGVLHGGRTGGDHQFGACGKLTCRHKKSPRFNGSRGWGEGENVCLFVQAVSV
jgi:hypothetical protein